MDRQAETRDLVCGAVKSDCKMEDAEATKSTLVLEALCKQEHLDGDWPETHANVYDSLFAVVKHEICDVSFEFERSGTIDDTTAEVTDLQQEPTQAILSGVNTDGRQTPTDENTGPTSTTNDSPLIQYSDSAAKSFSCKFCNFKCVKSYVFTNHMKTHIGRTYTCEHCDFKCGLKRALEKHIATHLGDKPFSCELCKAKFSQNGHLTNHMRMHETYRCEQCGYTCMLPFHFKNHMMHCTARDAGNTAGELQPLTCEHYKYKCSKASDLESHLLTHNAKKTFSCEYCNHRSSSASHLKEHVMTHTREKPFKCENCDYKCARARDLNRHNARNHPKKCLTP